MEITITFNNDTRLTIKKVFHVYINKKQLVNGFSFSIEYYDPHGMLVHESFEDVKSISVWEK